MGERGWAPGVDLTEAEPTSGPERAPQNRSNATENGEVGDGVGNPGIKNMGRCHGDESDQIPNEKPTNA